MELSKLFEMQKVLRDRIGYNEPDRFNKLILALLAEVGECAQEWRGFKFWSKDQEPRTDVLIECEECGGSGRGYYGFCGNCHGGYVGKRNLLLEEYVDGLHFVLELGIELDYKPQSVDPFLYDEITFQFIELYFEISSMENRKDYQMMFRKFIGLGEMLGFTWDQIEQAYMEKNTINHQRQSNGY